MRTLNGKIISIKMNQTVVVLTERLIKHPIYHKQLRRSKKYHAHAEQKLAVGDEVKIGEIKPMSKTKTWKVIEVTKKYGTA
jgi:small subunit ribosomal protein S17